MTGCSAPDCNNSVKKGYIMKVIPRNPEERAKWAANVGRLSDAKKTIKSAHFLAIEIRIDYSAES
ncbi:hypothetical protein ALC62_12665 [Cyphomyrmex costatus]|uniref:THAP-type domain-containing protein n=1 Tax=Cyphomyrmex costatus TaxID=456900 RepID=A0A151IB08_9HYME|nr:hypothetical protein ALC62_12665 [Cyphomyrmex costatus]